MSVARGHIRVGRTTVRRIGLAVALAGLITGLLVAPEALAAPTAHVAAPAPVCADTAADEAAARALARDCGRRVEAMTARTEFAQQYANADGTWTLEQSVEPQRVRRGTGWVPVDATLAVNSDGSVAPRAAALPMTFSGGGTAPLARMSNRDREMSISWPGRLPKPELSGNVALYRSVLPGVDLQVTAEPLGFSEVLVVHNKAAAANPQLAKLRFGMSTKDVTVTSEDGGLVARDAHGARVFTSPAPLMWDSSPASIGASLDASAVAATGRDSSARPDPSRQAPTGGGRKAVMAVEVAGSELVLTPDPRLMDDPGLTYPLYIDPSWTGNISNNAWTHVWSKYPTSSFWRNTTALLDGATKGSVGAGLTKDCDTCATYTIRSMFAMDTTGIKGKRIIDSQFRIEQRHAWTCSPASNAKLWLVGAISSSTTWNAQPYWNPDYTATTEGNHKIGAVHGCAAPATIEFNTTAMAVAAAAGNWDAMTVGLRAVSETTVNQWKRFVHTSPKLVVNYNTDPNAPTAGLADNKACATGSNRPYVMSTTPTLSVNQSDPDTDQQSLTTWFYWWPAGGTRNETDKVSQSAGNPAVVTRAIPAAKLVDGTSYVWQAYTYDGRHYGQFSALCEFTVDSTPPPTPASVTSAAYPADGQPHGGVGLDGSFVIAAPALRPQEAVAYAYTLDGTMQPSAAPTVPADAGTYGATVAIRPLRDGVNQLRVWAKDRAGRFSATPATYTFTVRAGTGPAAEWTFAESSGPAIDATGHGNSLTLGGGAMRTAGRGGVPSALTVDGTSGNAATAGPVLAPHPDTGAMVAVRTDTSFTVTARAKLSVTGGTLRPTVVAGQGTRMAPYDLGYSGPDNKWRFSMVSADTDSPGRYTVLADATATPGVWTHLAGVFDASTRQLRLYVNGVPQSTTATLVGGFNATGPVTIGRRWYAGSYQDHFNGSIDDVRLYGFVVPAADIAALAAPLPPTVTFPDGIEAIAGGTLRVRFDANGDTNVTAFKYSVFDADLDLTALPDVPGGAATVTIDVGDLAGEYPLLAVAGAGANLVSEATMTTFHVNVGTAIAGVVYDLSTFLPIEGALVTFNPGGQQLVTGPDGAYAFDGFAPGVYTVTANLGGACGPTTTVDVEVGEAGLIQDLFLNPFDNPCG